MSNSLEMDLNSIEWDEFVIGDIFSTSTGALLPKSILKKGKIARITATASNNGVFDYYQKVQHKNYREQTNFVSVSFLGSVFYHPYTASLDMKIHAIQIPGKTLNKYLAEFVIVALKKAVSLFSYGDQLSSSDLPKKKLLLPTTSTGKPDYVFMEWYMREKEQKKLTQYHNYIKNCLEKLKDCQEVVSLDEKEWGEFDMEKIFRVKSGKRLTKADMKKGRKPFIGATDSNNGITEFVSNINSSEDSNVLGVNYNGSVVENFYHPYKAIFSDDVKRISFRKVEGNKHLFLFVKSQILKQKEKYKYGYKFNATRMKRQKILLPVTQNQEPDYPYMENYMKRLEYDKLKQYLEYKIEMKA